MSYARASGFLPAHGSLICAILAHKIYRWIEKDVLGSFPLFLRRAQVYVVCSRSSWPSFRGVFSSLCWLFPGLHIILLSYLPDLLYATHARGTTYSTWHVDLKCLKCRYFRTFAAATSRPMSACMYEELDSWVTTCTTTDLGVWSGLYPTRYSYLQLLQPPHNR